jgi:hypothetical protein
VRVSETSARSSDANQIRIEADIGERRISLDPTRLADMHGRPRLGWAYASTLLDRPINGDGGTYASQRCSCTMMVISVEPALPKSAPADIDAGKPNPEISALGIEESATWSAHRPTQLSRGPGAE